MKLKTVICDFLALVLSMSAVRKIRGFSQGSLIAGAINVVIVIIIKNLVFMIFYCAFFLIINRWFMAECS